MRPIRDIETPVVMTSHQPPVARHQQPERMFGIAVRLPPNWGQAAIAFAILIGSIILTMGLLSGGDDQALIEAKDAHIASLETTNQLLAAANDNLAKVATNTITGLNPADFFAFGSVVLIAVGLTLICVPCLMPGGVFFAATGIILLLTGGG